MACFRVSVFDWPAGASASTVWSETLRSPVALAVWTLRWWESNSLLCSVENTETDNAVKSAHRLCCAGTREVLNWRYLLIGRSGRVKKNKTLENKSVHVCRDIMHLLFRGSSGSLDALDEIKHDLNSLIVQYIYMCKACSYISKVACKRIKFRCWANILYYCV